MACVGLEETCRGHDDRRLAAARRTKERNDPGRRRLEFDLQFEVGEAMAKADGQAHRPIRTSTRRDTHCDASSPAIAKVTDTSDRRAAVSPPFGVCSAVKMASGRVWVWPWMLPAKVITAPKSPRHEAKPTIAPTRTPGAVSGNTTFKKRSIGPAPSVRAA